MPEMHFRVEWPDGQQTDYYSPSLVIKKYFAEDSEYSVADFVERSRESLNIASDRVRAKFGFPCGRAMGALQAIERAAARYEGNSAVRVLKYIE